MRIIIPQCLRIVTSNIPSPATAAWNAETTYSAGDQVLYTATSAECAWQPKRLYESAQADNTGHVPAPDGTDWWIDRGAINRDKLLDGRNNSRTSAETSIELTVQVTGRPQSLALLGLRNVRTAEVTYLRTDINSIDGGLGVPYHTETVSLLRYRGEVGWWTWLFGETSYARSAMLTIPGGRENILITVKLVGEGPECGLVVAGESIWVGNSLVGASPGLRSFSRFKQDEEFGDVSYRWRQNTRVGEYDLALPTRDFDRIFATMEDCIGRLAVIDGNNDETNYDALRSYGIVDQFRPGLTYEYSTASLTVRGMD